MLRTVSCPADLYTEPGKAVVVCDGYREPRGESGCGAHHPALHRHSTCSAPCTTPLAAASAPAAHDHNRAARHALPRRVPIGANLAAVLIAVRERGGRGSTLTDVAQAAGFGRHTGVLLWVLCQTGRLVDAGFRLAPRGDVFDE